MFEIQSFLKEVSDSKQENAEDDSFLMLSHILCKTYGWDYYTLCNQPIPFIFTLMDMMKKQSEMEQKELNKSKRKK